MKVLDSTRYRDELVEAAHHYTDIRPALALRFITALDQARARAIAKPLAFRDRGHGVRAVLLQHFPYRLRFRLSEDSSKLFILSLTHTARKPE